MTYIAQSGEPNGDGGDMYTGLDRFGRVIDNRWINSSNVDIDRFQYGFSRASNRLWRLNTLASTFGEQYYYDNGAATPNPGLYQLYVRKRGTLSGGAVTGTPVETEQFLNNDVIGNWSTYQTYAGGVNTLNQSRTANKVNEYTAISPSGPTGYDSNGNMTTMPEVDVWATAQTLTYDAWNRPITVKQGGTTLGTYAYDGLNRRVTKISTESGSTVTRHFYYSNQWQVLEERTGSSTTADRQYIWGTRYIDDLILRDRLSGTVDRLYSLADYFQTTSICNTSGVIQERYVYHAFGDVGYYTLSWGASTSSFGWTYLYGSYQLDPETNLYQVRNRYYHSALGRWINRDPMEDAELTQGSNLYWYVQNNAVNVVDPMGLFIPPVIVPRPCLGPLGWVATGLSLLVGDYINAITDCRYKLCKKDCLTCVGQKSKDALDVLKGGYTIFLVACISKSAQASPLGAILFSLLCDAAVYTAGNVLAKNIQETALQEIQVCCLKL